MILAVEWPKASGDTGFSFEEIGARQGHVAIVACAIAARLDARQAVASLSVGLTGIGDRPVLLDTRRFLGAQPDDEWRRALARHAQSSFEFSEDMHASAEYRRHVAGWLIARGLERATRGPGAEDAA
jgi:carbon-monoxide dehydrogenase medium subunit